MLNGIISLNGQQWVKLSYSLVIHLKRLKKTTKCLSQDIRYPGCHSDYIVGQ
jgi:hypothetical protein